MTKTPTYEELEASVDLYHRCYQVAREIWRKDHPERAEDFDPSGEKAIAAMIAEHSIWEKSSLAELAKHNSKLKWRIAELETEIAYLTDSVDNLEDEVLSLEEELRNCEDNTP